MEPLEPTIKPAIKPAIEPTENQSKLFELIAEHSICLIKALIKQVLQQFGAFAKIPGVLPQLMIPFAEQSFNAMAHQICDNTGYINEIFDEMLNIDLGTPNHPMDILNTIVYLCLGVIRDLEIGDLEIGDLEINNSTDDALVSNIELRVYSHKHIASTFSGCTHVHEPINAGENVFSVEIMFPDERRITMLETQIMDQTITHIDK